MRSREGTQVTSDAMGAAFIAEMQTDMLNLGSVCLPDFAIASHCRHQHGPWCRQGYCEAEAWTGAFENADEVL